MQQVLVDVQRIGGLPEILQKQAGIGLDECLHVLVLRSGRVFVQPRCYLVGPVPLTTGNRVVEISPATFPPVIASKIIVLFLTRQESHLVIERRRLRFVQRARHIIEDSLQLRRDDRLTSELVQRRHRIRAIVCFLLELFGRQAKVLADHAGFRIVGQAIPCPVFGRVEVWVCNKALLEYVGPERPRLKPGHDLRVTNEVIYICLPFRRQDAALDVFLLPGRVKVEFSHHAPPAR